MIVKNKIVGAVAAGLLAAIALTGCAAGNYSTPAQERAAQQDAVTLDNSLGIEAQKERLSREDDESVVRYVYLINYGQVFGYYVITGGVYGADTQLAPEQEILRYGGNGNVVDSAKDNGTYGGGDSGVFFITSDGVLVETTLDYIQADAPIQVYANLPLLGGTLE